MSHTCPFTYFPTGLGETWKCPECGRAYDSQRFRDGFHESDWPKFDEDGLLDAWCWHWSGPGTRLDVVPGDHVSGRGDA